MTDASTLAASFPAATADDWRGPVEKTLKGEPLESLNKATLEGLPIAPLYPQADSPAAFPTRPHDAERPWDIRVGVAHPDPACANADLLAKGQDATFQNKVHLAMQAQGFCDKDDAAPPAN